MKSIEIVLALDRFSIHLESTVYHTSAASYLSLTILRLVKIFVNSGHIILDPNIPQFYEHSVVVFQVTEGADGAPARGPWTGPIRGIVRPAFQWKTEHISAWGRISKAYNRLQLSAASLSVVFGLSGPCG